MTNNETRALSFFEHILAQGQLDNLADFVAEDYRVHVPDLANLPELDNGIGALRKRLEKVGRLPNTVKRQLADGDYVLMHVRYQGNPDIAGADILRFDSRGKIAEHWFTRQAVPDKIADDSMFDGGGDPQSVVESDRIERNRNRLNDAYRQLFAEGQHELVKDFYAPVYRQHNPHMPDGSERLETMLKTKGPVVPTVFRIIAAGDLVAGHSFFKTEGLDNDMHSGDRTYAVDIFRLDDNNQFAEHWDVLQMESNALPSTTTFF
jgi:predicted SnoaL-like aldol condensation-catalyzing enzyme